jgi:hypothetical protein
MAQNLTNFDAALKEFYLPRMRSTINTNRVLMSRLERDATKTDVSGRRAVFPVNIRPSQAVGARSDEGALPTAQNQTYTEVRVSYKYNYGTIRLSHPTIVASRNDKGAFIRVVGSEMSGIRRDLKNDINRQLFGWGLGSLGTVNGEVAAAATTIVMDPGHQIKVGMVLDSYTSTTCATQDMDGKTVSSVTGNTIVMTAVVGATIIDGSYVFRADVANTDAVTAGGYEMMGLMGIVDSAAKNSGIGAFVTTLQNVARGTYPEWNAQVLEDSTPGTSRDITADLIDEAQLQVMEQAEGECSLGITSTTQFRKIGHLLTPERRYGVNQTLEGGFKAIEWAGTPIVWDRDCPVDVNGNDMMFMLDESTLAIYELADWDFDDTDGAILHRREGYAQYDAHLYYYAQLGCTDPANNLVIRDLSRS